MDQIQHLKMNNVQQSSPLRQNIITFEKLSRELPLVELKEGNIGRVELRVEHQFSYGVYARTLYIPKGVMLSGQIHKYENYNILLKGKLKVSIGEQMETIAAPFTVVSPANTKRIAIALEDCVWVTILGTHERNVEIIEKAFIAKSEEEYLEFIGANQPDLLT